MENILSNFKNKNHHFLFLCLLGFLVSCSKPLPKELAENIYPGEKELKITYFSTACLLIEYKDFSILTDPFISNHGWKDLLFNGMDKSYAHEHEDKIPDMSNVKLVIAGHSHYDHIADIPFFSKKINEDALILGNQSMLNIFANQGIKQQMLSIESLAGDYNTMGEWIYLPDSNIRVMPFKSQHMAHIGKIHFGSGGVKEPLDKLPAFFNNWREGQNLTFIIDFLSNDTILKRIYMQSSPHPSPVGLPPREILEEKSIDLAILGTVKINILKSYLFNYIEYLNPNEVFLCHWDNFFEPNKRRKNYLSFSKLPLQIKKLEEKFKKKSFYISIPIL